MLKETLLSHKSIIGMVFFGGLVFFGLILSLDLPNQIKRGEKGQVAIQMLDAMRRPFLAIKEANTYLIGTGDSKSASMKLEAANKSAKELLTRYLELSKYNPGLLERVEKLRVTYEYWIVNERRLFKLFPEISLQGNNMVSNKKLPALLSGASSAFLDTLNQLGEGEIPIHNDIDKGRYATRKLIILSGLLFFYIIALVLVQRKRKTNEIRNSEEKYHGLISSLQEGIWAIDKDDKTIFVNEPMAEMLGYSVDEMIGKKVFSFMDEQGIELCKYYIERRKQNVKEQHDFELIKKNGDRIYVTMEASPNYDENGNYVGGVTGVINITERKKAEMKLHESEEKYRRQFDEALDAIFIGEAETGILIDCNYAALELIARKKSELIGKHQKILHPPEEIEGEFSRTFKKHLKEKEGESLDAKVITKEGIIKDVSIKANMFEVSGKKYLQGIFRDITDRKQAERELQESENKLRLITENAVDYIFIKDINRRYKFVNKAMEALLGLRSEEILGKTPDEIYGPEQGQIIKEVDDRTFYGEIVNETKSLVIGDKEIFFNTLQTPLTIEDGNVTSIMGIVRDVSKLKRAESDLKEAKKAIEKWNMELEERVKEKTEELRKSEVQLIQSEKLSSIGQLAAGIAHELNSPLTGLISMTRNYRDKAEKDSEEYRHFSLMYKACEYMASIVNDISTFSSKSKGDHVECNLTEIIESSLRLVTNELKLKNIQLNKEYADELPAVKGNKNELQQVVLNMITNALDAMNEGGNYIIKTDISEDNNKVKMLFIDDGIGIAEKNLNIIFDPFFTTKRQGEGTGLGLSVSYGIIKNHNGEITVESELGKGANFTVILPAFESNNQ
jgi:PAS domain S-box-containing protein